MNGNQCRPWPAGLLITRLITRHDALSEILGSVGKFSSRFVVQKFKNKFGSFFKISDASLSVIAILAMERMNGAKTRAATKFAGSKNLRDLQRSVPIAVKSGSVPVVESSLKVKTMIELPGIAQLLKKVDQEEIDEH